MAKTISYLQLWKQKSGYFQVIYSSTVMLHSWFKKREDELVPELDNQNSHQGVNLENGHPDR